MRVLLLPALMVLALMAFVPVAQAGFNLQGTSPSGQTKAPSLSELANPYAAPVINDQGDMAQPNTAPQAVPFNDLPTDPALPLADVPPVPIQNASRPATIAPMVQTFTAQRGEDLFSVLQRFADQAGQPMTYASATEARITSDFMFTGRVEEAVDALLQANPQAGLWRQSGL